MGAVSQELAAPAKLDLCTPRHARRCPGRFFAESELALLASLLLLLFDFTLLPREGGGGGEGGGGEGGGAPGDPAGLLPPPDLRKLVGIKVPAGPCWAAFQQRRR